MNLDLGRLSDCQLIEALGEKQIYLIELLERLEAKDKTMQTSRNERRQLAKDNAKQALILTQVPKEKWPSVADEKRTRLWRSRDYVVQEFAEKNATRLSINRTMIDVTKKRWNENITWEELQTIKREIGYGNVLCVEIFPADHDVVNVASMRHLWIPHTDIDFGWKKD